MSDYFVYEEDYPEEGTILSAESEDAAIEQYHAETGYPDTPCYAVEVDYCHSCNRLKANSAPIREEDGQYCACPEPAKREWVLTVTITGPDEESATASLAYDSMDKLTGFPDECGNSIVRNLAGMMVQSCYSDDAPTGKEDDDAIQR